MLLQVRETHLIAPEFSICLKPEEKKNQQTLIRGPHIITADGAL